MKNNDVYLEGHFLKVAVASLGSDQRSLVIRRAIVSVFLATTVLFGGCASLPRDVNRPPSVAFALPQDTALGRWVAQAAPTKRLSGFHLLTSGQDAVDARLALIDQAEKTLDLQYFIVRDDAVAREVFRRLKIAAARGVRVRVLVDDLYTTGQDSWLASFTNDTHIEVRIFNPFPGGRWSFTTRLLQSIGNLSQLNRRMHNKLFIADNAVAIFGGRNLDSEYFSRSDERNFVDFDMLTGGPVVPSLSRTFDAFWNSELAYPVQSLEHSPWSPAEENKRHGYSMGSSLSASAASTIVPTPPNLFAVKLIWSPARVLADKPDKVDPELETPDDATTGAEVLEILSRAKSEIEIITPYFVPGTTLLKTFHELRQRGVAIRVLTNSLATTDMPAAHAGYARHRPELLEMGVELHELKPDAGQARNWKIDSHLSSNASLHGKAISVDGRVALVGSMNLDPRSEHLNTEDGVVISSPLVASQVVAIFKQGTSLESSFLVTQALSGERLQWLTKEGKDTLRFDVEPRTPLWLRFITGFMEMTAPEDFL